MFGRAFDSAGQVDVMAERSVVRLFVAARVADHGDARVDADADAEFRVQLLAPFFVEVGKLLLHSERGLAGQQWVIGLLDRGIPHGHQTVAEIADGCAGKLAHASVQPVHDRLNELTDILRADAFRQAREVANVGK